jgi:hypothetical protein
VAAQGINCNQSRVYATYLGGSNDDEGHDIAVDAAGSAYVTGSTASSNFPTTAKAFQKILKAALVGETDAFVTKLNATGSALAYSTYLGGNRDDEGNGIAVDSSGSVAYVTGFASKESAAPGAPPPDFQVTSTQGELTYHGGISDAFVTKLSTNPSACTPIPAQGINCDQSRLYSIYLGGNSEDKGFGIALREGGNEPYVTGSTLFPTTCMPGNICTFPTTAGAYKRTPQGKGDAFVTKISSTVAINTFNQITTDDPALSNVPTSRGFGGVTVKTTRTDGTIYRACTDVNGFYKFLDLPKGDSYTVFPSKPGYNFSAVSTAAQQVVLPHLTDDLGDGRFKATATQVTPTCNYTISPTMKSFNFNGGTDSVSVTTSAGCACWLATSPVSWITITETNNVNGSGTITYKVLANPTTTSRTAMLTIAGKSFKVTQTGH